VAEDLERSLVAETLPAAVEQAGVEPVAEPSVDAEPPEQGGPFRYTARIEVKPAIELPDLAGLKGERPAVTVDEEEIDREIESLRERRATLADEPEETELATGLHATVDFVGRIDGEAFEGGTAQGATIEIGSGQMIPGFEDQLTGAKKGDDVEVAVTFPEDYREELAGKDATFAVHVAAVQRRVMPEVDDAFAKEVADVESVDALRERVGDDLRESRERNAKTRLRETLMDDVLGRFDFEVPPGLVERRVASRLESAHRQLAQAMPHEELHQQLTRWQEEWRPAAEREVREEIVLEAVAQDAGIEVADEELDERMETMARDQGVDVKRLRDAYEQGGALEGLRAGLLEEKGFDHLVEKAKIEEVSEA